MKRSKPLRRKTPMRRKRTKPRRGRARDPEYMAKVRRLACVVRAARQLGWPFMPVERSVETVALFVTNCSGRVQADHMGERGHGAKSHDRETVPMCKSHHDQRTNGCGVSGTFRFWTKSEMRAFREWAIERTQREVAEMR